MRNALQAVVGRGSSNREVGLLIVTLTSTSSVLNNNACFIKISLKLKV